MSATEPGRILSKAEVRRCFEASTSYTLTRQEIEGQADRVGDDVREIERVTATGVYIKAAPEFPMTRFSEGKYQGSERSTWYEHDGEIVNVLASIPGRAVRIANHYTLTPKGSPMTHLLDLAREGGNILHSAANGGYSGQPGEVKRILREIIDGIEQVAPVNGIEGSPIAVKIGAEVVARFASWTEAGLWIDSQESAEDYRVVLHDDMPPVAPDKLIAQSELDKVSAVVDSAKIEGDQDTDAYVNEILDILGVRA